MKAVKFSTPTCATCKSLSAFLQKEGIKVEEQELTRENSVKYGIRSVPTIVILDDDGNRMESFVGSKLTEEQIEKLKGISNGS